jgi:hypothetical protein
MRRIISFVLRYVYAIGSCLYLFTLGLFSARNRFFISTICEHFGYIQRTRTIIPKVGLPEVVPENVDIQIREPIRSVGNLALLEVIVIAKLTRYHNPDRLFEIGTFDGRTTLNMAANCPEDAKVYTLDLPGEQIHSTKLPVVPVEKIYIDKEISGSRYLGTDCEEKIVQLYGDSAIFDFSSFFDTIDFVFVDGSHSYEYALNDSERAIRLLRDGRGIILWHDYGQWDGVTRALNELYSKAGKFEDLKHIEGTSLVCLIID